jgi:hypothetical protein
LQIRQKIEFPQRFAGAESAIKIALLMGYAWIERGSMKLI